VAVRSAILASSDSLASCFLEATVLEKDLGIWSDPSLKFSVHVTNVVNKANQILGLTKIVYIMDLSLMKTLYTALVRPHLEYGNVVWHPFLRRIFSY